MRPCAAAKRCDGFSNVRLICLSQNKQKSCKICKIGKLHYYEAMLYNCNTKQQINKFEVQLNVYVAAHSYL